MISLATFLIAAMMPSAAGTLGDAALAHHASAPDAKVGTITAIPIAMNVWRLALGADGDIWFGASPSSGEVGTFPYIGRLDPATLLIRPFYLPGAEAASQPIAAPDGNVWFIEGGGFGPQGPVLKITHSGKITEYRDGVVGGPLRIGPDGAIWGATGNDEASTFVRITLDGKYYSIPPPQAPSQPRTLIEGGALTAGPGGNIWYCNDSYPNQAIDEMTTSGQLVAAYPVSADYCTIITAGVDGNLYSDVTNQYILTQTTPTGQMTVYSQYSPEDSDMQADPIDGSLWFGQGNNLIEFWPATGQTKTYSLDNYYWPWSFAIDHKHNRVWFTSLSNSSMIYRLIIAPPQTARKRRTATSSAFR